jgi:hypothetical protein
MNIENCYSDKGLRVASPHNAEFSECAAGGFPLQGRGIDASFLNLALEPANKFSIFNFHYSMN